MKELNTHGREIAALSRANRPVRVFYSEASAINDEGYLDRIDEAYRALYHEGIYLGIESARSLQRKGMKRVAGEAVLVLPGVTFVTAEDKRAVVDFVAAGGTVFLAGDGDLKKDEYGRPAAGRRVPATARVVHVPDLDAARLLSTVRSRLERMDLLPLVECSENNGIGKPGCMWRAVRYEGDVLFVVANLGRSRATLTIEGKGGRPLAAHDLIENAPSPTGLVLEPCDVKLLRLSAD
jgi:beta-galactosidase